MNTKLKQTNPFQADFPCGKKLTWRINEMNKSRRRFTIPHLKVLSFLKDNFQITAKFSLDLLLIEFESKYFNELLVWKHWFHPWLSDSSQKLFSFQRKTTHLSSFAHKSQKVLSFVHSIDNHVHFSKCVSAKSLLSNFFFHPLNLRGISVVILD